MAVGQVSFHNDKKVPLYLLTMLYLTHPYNRSNEVFSHKVKCVGRRTYASLDSVHVAKRENAIVNRLNKSKVEREVDHEQERVDRIKRENAVKRAAAAEKVIQFREVFGSFSNSAMFPLIEKARCRIGEKKRRRKGCSIVRFFV